MDLDGWHYFHCRPQLLEVFWGEFWAGSGVEKNSNVDREHIRAMAEKSAIIGAMLRYAFDRKEDGSPSEVLSTSEVMLSMLKAFISEETRSQPGVTAQARPLGLA